jgi:hypothetical protein
MISHLSFTMISGRRGRFSTYLKLHNYDLGVLRTKLLLYNCSVVISICVSFRFARVTLSTLFHQLVRFSRSEQEFFRRDDESDQGRSDRVQTVTGQTIRPETFPSAALLMSAPRFDASITIVVLGLSWGIEHSPAVLDQSVVEWGSGSDSVRLRFPIPPLAEVCPIDEFPFGRGGLARANR